MRSRNNAPDASKDPDRRKALGNLCHEIDIVGALHALGGHENNIVHAFGMCKAPTMLVMELLQSNLRQWLTDLNRNEQPSSSDPPAQDPWIVRIVGDQPQTRLACIAA